jgi:DNA-binding IscR family transcriptional regulator
MRPVHLVIEDAVALRGIVDLLEAGPATTGEIAMMQHTSDDVARRLCKKLQEAGIIDHTIATKAVLVVGQQVSQINEWKLAYAYAHGEFTLNAERLAGGRA